MRGLAWGNRIGPRPGEKQEISRERGSHRRAEKIAGMKNERWLKLGLSQRQFWGPPRIFKVGRKCKLAQRFFKTFTHYTLRRSNFFQCCTTGAALISAIPRRIRSFSSALDLTRICRKKVWAIFPKSVSTK